MAVITRIGDRLGVLTLPIAAFCGGMCATAVVLLLLRRAAGYGPERLVLAGLAVSFLFTALTNYLVFSGDQRAAHSVLFWTMGGLGLATWQNIGIGLFGAALALVYALLRHRALDALLAGEQTAESLGISVTRLRNTTFLVASFATALLVSIAGVIGFIGLMIPHVARAFAGPLHARLAVASAVMGAALLLGSDLLARTLLPPQELPRRRRDELDRRRFRHGAHPQAAAELTVPAQPRCSRSQWPGVMPKALRKCRVRCAWSAKPASAAASARGRPPRSARRARSSRRMIW